MQERDQRQPTGESGKANNGFEELLANWPPERLTPEQCEIILRDLFPERFSDEAENGLDIEKGATDPPLQS